MFPLVLGVRTLLWQNEVSFNHFSHRGWVYLFKATQLFLWTGWEGRIGREQGTDIKHFLSTSNIFLFCRRGWNQHWWEDWKNDPPIQTTGLKNVCTPRRHTPGCSRGLCMNPNGVCILVSQTLAFCTLPSSSISAYPYTIISLIFFFKAILFFI